MKFLYTVSQKKQAKLFLLYNYVKLPTKSDNFWHKDGKQKIIWGALIFHLT